jgi:hypothetical protein
MTAALAALFAGERPAGLYRIAADIQPESVRSLAADHGWRAYHVDGRQVTDKASFIRAVGVAMDFPAWSGLNWDAFEESVRDLSWAPASGYVLVYDDPDRLMAADGEAWAVARSILEGAAEHWRDLGVPWAVLFRKAGRSLPDLPWL